MRNNLENDIKKCCKVIIYPEDWLRVVLRDELRC